MKFDTGLIQSPLFLRERGPQIKPHVVFLLFIVTVCMGMFKRKTNAVI